MKYKLTLVHRYNDPRDILAVPLLKCSEAHARSKTECECVLVIPTTTIDCKFAAYGIAMSPQYIPEHSCNWPSRIAYKWHVDLDQIHFVTLGSIRQALIERRLWSASLNVFPVTLEEDRLEIFEEDSLQFKSYKRNALRSFVRASL